MPGPFDAACGVAQDRLVPGIHELLFFHKKKGVDGRAKPGHDELCK